MENTLKNYLYQFELHEEVENAKNAGKFDSEKDIFDEYKDSLEFLKLNEISEEELSLEFDY